MSFGAKLELPSPATALPGRSETMPVPAAHFVNGAPLVPPFPSHLAQLQVGMGCFWGAERKFWQAEGVFTTAVGYAGGITPNPSYEEVCSGRTGHTEVVLVVYDPASGATSICMPRCAASGRNAAGRSGSPSACMAAVRNGASMRGRRKPSETTTGALPIVN